MTVHAFQLYYSPSQEMDDLVSSFLDVADDWSKEELDYPSKRTFGELNPDVEELEASGFGQNRFVWQDTGKRPAVDAREAVKGLDINIDKINQYTDWWILKWHMCDHDGDKNHSCGYFDSSGDWQNDWMTLMTSENHGMNVPKQVR